MRQCLNSCQSRNAQSCGKLEEVQVVKHGNHCKLHVA